MVNLNRFVLAQDPIYKAVIEELENGRKETHWMWFIFPQLAGLGSSAMSKKFAISNLDEAKAYLKHPTLGKRLRECCQKILETQGLTITQILGYPDDMKLRSSLTLFHQADETEPLFIELLAKFFHGTLDSQTIALLGENR